MGGNTGEIEENFGLNHHIKSILSNYLEENQLDVEKEAEDKLSPDEKHKDLTEKSKIIPLDGPEIEENLEKVN